MNDDFIDVWDPDSFDDVLLGELREHEQLICDYLDTEVRLFTEREASDHRGLPETNPHHGQYLWLTEHITDYMELRTIRAWHYTRLAEDETVIVRERGVYPSTLGTIRRRLDVRVAAGDFTTEMADLLFASSPFRDCQQLSARSGKFWMTSHPVNPDNGGVELLLGNWGGEGVYFWLQDKSLEDLVGRLGKPRVLELAVPLNLTSHGYRAADAVIGSFARSLGRVPEREAFDLCTTHALGPDTIINIHAEGDPTFIALGRGYPAGFVHPDLEPADSEDAR